MKLKRLLSLFLAVLIMLPMGILSSIFASADLSWENNVDGQILGSGEYFTNGTHLMVGGTGILPDGALFYNNEPYIEICSGITGIGKNNYESQKSIISVSLPDTLTSIGSYAFFYCDSLASINIPNQVTSIGKCALAGTAITSINIPASVTDIDEPSFASCPSLTSINVDSSNQVYCDIDGVLFNKLQNTLISFPGGITTNYEIPEGTISIAEDAFNYSSVADVTIPDSVEYIGDHAFMNNASLESITIPSSVEHIGEFAFWNCENLKDIYFKGTEEEWNTNVSAQSNSFGSGIHFHFIKTWENRVNGNTLGSGTYYSDGQTLYVEGTGILPDGIFDSNAETKLVIGSGITGIGEENFKYSLFSEVLLPNTLTSIGEEAFLGSEALTSINIPVDVTSIGKNAFSQCTGLTSISVAENSGSFSSVDGVLFDYDGTGLILFPAANAVDYIVPDGTKSIAAGAFQYSGIKTITLPTTIETIAQSAFLNCPALTDIWYNGTETEWNENVPLGSNAVPAGVSINFINHWQNIISGNPVGTGTYYSKDGTLYINGTGALPEGIFPFTDETALVIGEGITGIGSSNFYFAQFESVSLPSTLTKIDYTAFSLCLNLTDIDIPAAVTEIGPMAFAECYNLESINVDPDNTAYCDIGGVLYSKNQSTLVAFPSGKSTSYTIPSGTEIISGYAFAFSSIETVDIPDTVTTIGNSAFYFSNLSSISIPASVTVIDESAFENCSDLSDLYYDGTEEEWNTYVLLGNNAIPQSTVKHFSSTPAFQTWENRSGNNILGSGTYYSGGNTLYIYGTGALPYNQFPYNNETKLVIGEGITEIGFQNFYSTSFERVSLPSTLTSIDAYAFYCCSDLIRIDIPAAVTTIEPAAFTGTTALEGIYVDSANTAFSDVDGVLFDKEQKSLIAFPSGTGTEYNIPAGTVTVYSYAFAGSNLSNVEIPDSVTTIGAVAFYSTSLVSVEIPTSVAFIGEYAFDSCSSLTDIWYLGSEGDWDTRVTVLTDAIPASVQKHFTSDVVPDNWENIIDSVSYGSGTYYTYNDTLYIEGTGILPTGAFPYHNETKLVIGEGITGINNMNFVSTDIEKVSLPSTLKYLYFGAFAATKLTSINLPADVSFIGASVFEGCTSLTSINVDDNNTVYCDIDGVVYSKDKATLVLFPEGKATSFSIPDSVSDIAPYSFYDCGRLTSITIPVSVKNIGDYAFDYCDSLTDIWYGGTETEWNENITIGSNAFPSGVTKHFASPAVYSDWINTVDSSIIGSGTYCTVGNTLYIYGSGILPDGAFPYSNETKLFIGEGITGIGSSSFESTKIAEVSLPSTLSSIGFLAFYNAPLTNVDIPAGISYIGPAAFAGCTKLTSINVDDNNIVYCDIEGVLFSKDLSSLIVFPAGITAEYSVPYGTETIDYYAFCNSSVENVIIPDTVSDISSYAFFNCIGLTSITIPILVEHIGSYAFQYCFNLETINYAGTEGEWDTYVSLDNNAIPDGVSINFLGSEEIAWRNEVNSTVLGSGTYYSKNGTLYINGTGILPDRSSYYHNETALVIGEGITGIGKENFASTAFDEVSLPSTLTSIDDGAFSLSLITSIDIPANVTNISSTAFLFSNYLESINVDENNPAYCDIDGVLFNKETTELVHYPSGKGYSYTVPEGTESIGDHAFAGSLLNNISLPNGITEIGTAAFGYTDIQSISIPASVTSIGEDAFADCEQFTDLYYNGTEAEWISNVTIGNNAIPPVVTKHFAEAPQPPVAGLPGDINGDNKLNNRDILNIKKAIANQAALDVDPNAADLYTLNDQVLIPDTATMDINKDGKVNNRDLLLIKKMLANVGVNEADRYEITDSKGNPITVVYDGSNIVQLIYVS